MAHLFDPEWVHVDTIVASAATTPTFASGGNGIRSYVPNGNVDLGYRITYDLTGNAVTGAVARIELQGGTTNQTGIELATDGTSLSGTALVNMGVAASGLVGSRHQGEWVMNYSPTGAQRSSYLIAGSSGATKREVVTGGRYNDTATNITSIRFNVTTGDVTGTIRLYVRNPQKGGY